MSFIEIATDIYNTLGHGYSEAVYHNAFEVALRAHGISYETERILPVSYMDKIIGNLRIDLLINGRTVIELKATRRLSDDAITQVKMYKTMLGLPDDEQAYVFNFGSTELQYRLI